ncbi:MAG: flippase-like domain-containing protein [Actinobacteria bacterium]|nr:flippase-like domain-containing protein [Actinomycetota bacterium]MDQ3530887.1 lysylphosphatidylglycerol synthase domain-containing protein [Actinomycetota bacterium]
MKIVLSLALVAGVFFGILPEIADFSKVWAAIVNMSWVEVGSLLVAGAWNIATYQFVVIAVLPGLSYWQAFVVGQSSTAISTTLPAGSALGVGVTYSMYSAWGRSGPEIALAAVLTGLWNNFIKLGLPIVALAVLAAQGKTDRGLIGAAVIGVLVLIAAVALFALMLRSSAFALRIGSGLGRVVSRLLVVVHKPPVDQWGDAAVRFRAGAIDLLRHRWLRLTVATVVSHLSLFFVLLLALRHMDVTSEQVGWAEALGAFALIRLVTALPVTPGGLGLVELGLTAALVLAGGREPGVVAAVLVYRFLTLLVQVPLGAISYLVWQRRAGRESSRSVTTAPQK